MQENAHKGHRIRMRRKLLEFSHRVFDTYELLEMLLYYTNSVRDTNPIAKNLLSRFGSLDAVLLADADELSSVVGIGAESVGLIKSAERACRFFEVLDAQVTEADEGSVYADICRLLSGYECATTVLVSLDNAGRVIGKDKLFSLDFSSGGIKPSVFVSRLLEHGAVSCIIAHSHPFGPAFPSESDMETERLVTGALSAVGIRVNACIVTCGSSYYDMISRKSVTVSPSLADDSAPLDEGATEVLTDLFSSAFKDGAQRLQGLIARAPAASALLTPSHTTHDEATERERTLLSLIPALASRRISEKYTAKRRYSQDELKRCLVGQLLGSPREQVVMLSIDGGGALISCDFICEGTVSSSEILPRMLLDCVGRRGAKSVILAHNHPFGRAVPSDEDIAATKRLCEVLRLVDVSLDAHYVVAEGKAVQIQF